MLCSESLETLCSSLLLQICWQIHLCFLVFVLTSLQNIVGKWSNFNLFSYFVSWAWLVLFLGVLVAGAFSVGHWDDKEEFLTILTCWPVWWDIWTALIVKSMMLRGFYTLFLVMLGRCFIGILAKPLETKLYCSGSWFWYVEATGFSAPDTRISS